jgi:hypothetical protein
VSKTTVEMAIRTPDPPRGERRHRYARACSHPDGQNPRRPAWMSAHVVVVTVVVEGIGNVVTGPSGGGVVVAGITEDVVVTADVMSVVVAAVAGPVFVVVLVVVVVVPVVARLFVTVDPREVVATG